MSGDSPRPRTLLALAILIGVVLAAHVLVVGGEFVYDDVVIVEQNPRLRSWSGLAEVWRTTYWGDAYEAGLWRPLSLSTFVVEYQLFGPRPWAFRLTNLLLHVACTLGVLGLLRRIGLGHRAAWLAALVFGVHPVHAEVVTSVVGRTDLLATFFAILALLAFFRFRDAGSGLSLSALGACFVAGLLSKELMICLPLILIGVDLLGRPPGHGRPVGRRLLRPYLLIAAIVLVYLPIRQSVIGALGPQGENQVFIGDSFAVRAGTMLGVLVDYVGMFLVPVNLAADFPYLPGESPGFDLRAALGALGLGAALLAAWTRRGAVAFAVVVFLAGLAPVSNLVIVTGIVKAARLLYLPSIGLALGLGFALAVAWRRPALRPVVVAIVVLFGTIHARYTWTWRNNERLWRHTLRISPDSSKGLYNLGAIHARRGQRSLGEGKLDDAAADLVEAERLFTEAARLRPDDPGLPLALGRLYLLTGRLDAAEQAFRHGLGLDPPERQAIDGMLGLAEVFANTDRLAQAQTQLEVCVGLQPSAPGPRLHLARVLIDRGQVDAAREHLETILAAQGDPAAGAHARARAMLDELP